MFFFIVLALSVLVKLCYSYNYRTCGADRVVVLINCGYRYCSRTAVCSGRSLGSQFKT